jgi:hypothetical protein
VAAAERHHLPPGFGEFRGLRRDNAIMTAWETALRDAVPVVETETDEDGRYDMSLPTAKDYFLVCLTRRRLAGEPELNVWIVKCPVSVEHLDLNSGNRWVQPE